MVSCVFRHGRLRWVKRLSLSYSHWVGGASLRRLDTKQTIRGHKVDLWGQSTIKQNAAKYVAAMRHMLIATGRNGRAKACNGAAAAAMNGVCFSCAAPATRFGSITYVVEYTRRIWQRADGSWHIESTIFRQWQWTHKQKRSSERSPPIQKNSSPKTIRSYNVGAAIPSLEQILSLVRIFRMPPEECGYPIMCRRFTEDELVWQYLPGRFPTALRRAYMGDFSHRWGSCAHKEDIEILKKCLLNRCFDLSVALTRVQDDSVPY